jgi:hypothetical protein
VHLISISAGCVGDCCACSLALQYADVNEVVRTFASGSALLGLVEDLVTSKPHFRQRWTAATGSNAPRPFVPQTALMIFRRAAFARLFGQWESIWRKWIEPAPFAYYGDPDPAFHGSAFCIEQYALGLALEQLNMVSQRQASAHSLTLLLSRVS